MKTIILCGGEGTRLKEETEFKPKPMVYIGDKPLIWHIMKIYSYYGFNEFIVALGYKGNMIKEYFMHERTFVNDFSLDTKTGDIIFHNNGCDDFKITFAETGSDSLTGERVLRLKKYIDDDGFMLTYGDGVADIDINALLKFHKSHGRLATITTVHSPERFGRIAFEGNQITAFYEKPAHAEGWINGGYFVLNSKVFDYIENDETIWERSPVERLAHDGQLFGYRHSGFWSCMDTLKEKNFLEELWNSGKAPWKVW